MRNWRRVLILASTVFFCGLVMWMAAHSDASRHPLDRDESRFAMRGSASSATHGVPKAVVEQTEHYLGFLDPAEQCAHVFMIRNEGQAPLKLTRGGTSCKCTMSELPDRPIPPGGTAEVRVASKIAQQSGDFAHSATIFTNDPNRKRVRLLLHGTIRKYVAADPKRIVLSAMRREEARSVGATLYSQVWESFRVEDVTSTLDGLNWQIGPADPETLSEWKARSGYRLEVAVPPNLPAGNFWHELEMSVVPGDGSPARTFSLDVTGSVLSRITIYGPKLLGGKILKLGTIPEGEGARERLTMKVRDDHRRLLIERVETDPEFLQVEVVPLDSGNEDLGLYRIDVEIPPDAPIGDFISHPGEFRIVSDHPKLPVLALKVAFAVVPMARPVIEF
jgi:hypothetical protein